MSDDDSKRPILPVPRAGREVVDSLPGLARVAASAAWHTTEWGVRTSARSALRLGRAVTDPDEALALAREAGATASVISELARAISAGTPVAEALHAASESLGADVRADQNGHGGDSTTLDGHRNGSHRPARSSEEALRERGQELLRRSRDVWSDDVGHPAYERILDEMAPDEGRILLLLLEGGPQPSVDVRTGGPIGLVSSTLIAPGLTMIGARAGARHVDQVPAYLNNLFRLGLVWFSRESLRDPMDYQVLEAQPDVLEAMHSVKFAKVVRRSIHLTPFGEDFGRRCLLAEDAVGVALPEHSTPPASEAPDTGSSSG